MIGARSIVACTLRSKGTEEYRTGIDHLFGQLHIVLGLHNQVLGSILIGQFDGFFHILHQNQLTVFQRLLGYLPTRQASQLMLHFVLHFFEQLLGCSDKHHLTIHSVFGLREKVSSHELRISGFISNHFHFRRTGRHINSHIVKRHHLLGCHHILVTRTENLVHLGHTLSTISHSSDGLHTTRLEYLAYTCHLSCIEDGWIDFSFLVRRGTKYDFLTTCDLGRYSQHQHSREKRSRSTRYIQTHLLDAHSLLPTSHTFHRFHLLAFKLLLLVECIDVSLCQ